MGRSPGGGCSGVKKGLWTSEEDQKLVEYVQKNGIGSWRALPKDAGLNRCGKSCRLRWINYLRPDIKRGKFSNAEESIIVNLHSNLGNKWSRIAAHLPGRTDNEIKNFWNTHLKKKLLQMGIDPKTHKPIPDFNLLSNLFRLLSSSDMVMNHPLANFTHQLAKQLQFLQMIWTPLQPVNTGNVCPHNPNSNPEIGTINREMSSIYCIGETGAYPENGLKQELANNNNNNNDNNMSNHLSATFVDIVESWEKLVEDESGGLLWKDFIVDGDDDDEDQCLAACGETNSSITAYN